MSDSVMSITTDALADVHVHLREGDAVGPLIAHSVEGGADFLGAMPNTDEGLTTARAVVAYINRAEELVLLPSQLVSFMPFVMITEKTTLDEIDRCVEVGITHGKIYPFLRTTKSHNGVVHYGRILPVIKHCGKVGMTCHFHPEHPSMDFGSRDAEFAFVPLMLIFLEETQAKLVWEHGTDADCIPHWETMAKSGRFAITLTAHHPATNEDLVFGDVRAVCKPPIKTEGDRRGLVDLVAKDYPWVMAGSDSAFHDIKAKHTEKRGCACGACTAKFLLPLYAHALDKILSAPGGTAIFERFTSHNARSFHRLPPASRKVTLVRESFEIPLTYQVGLQTAMPFWAGQTINWRIKV